MRSMYKVLELPPPRIVLPFGHSRELRSQIPDRVRAEIGVVLRRIHADLLEQLEHARMAHGLGFGEARRARFGGTVREVIRGMSDGERKIHEPEEEGMRHGGHRPGGEQGKFEAMAHNGGHVDAEISSSSYRVATAALPRTSTTVSAIESRIRFRARSRRGHRTRACGANRTRSCRRGIRSTTHAPSRARSSYVRSTGEDRASTTRTACDPRMLRDRIDARKATELGVRFERRKRTLP